MKTLRQLLFGLMCIYAVLGFLYVSEQDYQDEKATEEFYNDK